MNKVFFRIIVPNFNNFKFIKKCLDSILNQTFNDWYCIIIDDMSTDKSDEIAEVYTRRFPDKFTLLRSTEKRYAGGCRNYALSIPIESQYTWFIDGDDFINKNALQICFETLSKEPVDILLFDWDRQLPNGEIVNSEAHGKRIENLMNRLSMCPWCGAPLHIQKSNIVGKFLEKCGYGEDTYQWLNLWNKDILPTYKQLTDKLYVYVTNINSTVQTALRTNNGFRIQTKPVFHKALEEMIKDIKNKYIFESIKNRLCFEFSKSDKERLQRNLRSLNEYKY